MHHNQINISQFQASVCFRAMVWPSTVLQATLSFKENQIQVTCQSLAGETLGSFWRNQDETLQELEDGLLGL